MSLESSSPSAKDLGGSCLPGSEYALGMEHGTWYQKACAAMHALAGIEDPEKFVRAADEWLDSLRRIVSLVDSAGLDQLSRGVELGKNSWRVKASDEFGAAKIAIAAYDAEQGLRAAEHRS